MGACLSVPINSPTGKLFLVLLINKTLTFPTGSVSPRLTPSICPCYRISVSGSHSLNTFPHLCHTFSLYIYSKFWPHLVWNGWVKCFYYRYQSVVAISFDGSESSSKCVSIVCFKNVIPLFIYTLFQKYNPIGIYCIISNLWFLMNILFEIFPQLKPDIY